MSNDPAINKPPFYKTILRPTLFVVGLLFFIALIARSWTEIKDILQTLNWSLFLFSAFIALLDNVLFSFLFQNLLTKYNFDIDYPRIGKMYFYGQMTKYIPGQLWAILYHATFLQRRGATSAMLFANLDLMAVIILRSIAIALAIILFYQQAWFAVIIFIIGSFGFWYLSKSCWIARIFQFVAGYFKAFTHHISLCETCSKNRNIWLVAVSTWVTYLTANFLVMKATFNFPMEQSALYIAYLSLAWVVGVIAIAIPAGIGIREIVFIFLAQSMGQGQAPSVEMLAAIAIVYRFWHILLEFGGLGFGFVLSRIKKNDL
ncbi:MAG: flippase-like domain-containing protein [Chloroflexi bacterium]|nr:flippase-like domain-containing protein [Chloroflexota bacterium]